MTSLLEQGECWTALSSVMKSMPRKWRPRCSDAIRSLCKIRSRLWALTLRSWDTQPRVPTEGEKAVSGRGRKAKADREPRAHLMLLVWLALLGVDSSASSSICQVSSIINLSSTAITSQVGESHAASRRSHSRARPPARRIMSLALPWPRCTNGGRGRQSHGHEIWIGLPKHDYAYLDRWLNGRNKRLDKWSRAEILTFGCPQALRHGNTGDKRRPMNVDSLGFVPFAEPVDLKGFRILDASAEEIKQAVLDCPKSGKHKDDRFVVEGELVRTHQGESEIVQQQIDENQRDVIFAPGVPGWVDYPCHGTNISHIKSIFEKRLLCGGLSGDRADVHFEAGVRADGRRTRGQE